MDIIKKAFPKASLVSCKPLGKGCVNRNFELKIRNPSKRLIVRRYSEGWKAEKEAYVYRLMASNGIPVPEVYYHSKKESLSIQSLIEGKQLTENRKLIEKAGEYLAKIHSIKFSKFGWIVGKEIKPSFNRWADFCDYDLKLKLGILKKRIDKQLLAKILKDYNSRKELLEIKAKPCLIHKDYHSSHILVNKGKINGIIDVEWAMSGHNELDLTKSLLWMFDKNKKLQDIFMSGYKRFGAVSDEFEERRGLYNVLTMVSAASFSCELKNHKWLKYNLRRLRGLL